MDNNVYLAISGVIVAALIQLLKKYKPQIESNKWATRGTALAAAAIATAIIDYNTDNTITFETWTKGFLAMITGSELSYQYALKWIASAASKNK